MNNLMRAIIASCCLIFMLPQAQAKPAKTKATQAAKERLVLMPLRVAEEDKALQGAMETALAQGLQQKYEVFSGEQVAQKARQIFNKESRNTAKKECDETRCMQGIAEAFQAELIASANIAKRDDGYFLALSVQNIFDNKLVYSNSLPCKNCDAYQVVDKLKELSGAATTAVATSEADALQSQVTSNDSESALWGEVQKGNTVDDYQTYLDTYPKGKYVPLAKARLKKLNNAAQTNVGQQAQNPTGKNTQQLADECVFPASSTPAPLWVCDAPVEGYELTFVGSAPISVAGADNSEDKLPPYQAALLDAMVHFSQSLKVNVENMIKNYVGADHQDSEKSDQNNSEVKKWITSDKFGNVAVSSTIKQYRETTGENKDNNEEVINTISSKLSMDQPCVYQMKYYKEINSKGDAQVVSEEAGKQCTIKDVTKELSRNGIEVVNTVTSPKGELFILLGLTEESVRKKSEEAIRHSMENDKAAWEKLRNADIARQRQEQQ